MTARDETSEKPGRPDQPGRAAPRLESARDARTGRSAAAARVQHQTQWVELQLQRARERGDFDDLRGMGEPIPDLGREHDPDWWVKRLVERENVTGVLPPALQLRKDDAELDGLLDFLTAEAEVRREVTDFNDRVRRALYGNPGGPPLITRPRDVEAEVAAWRGRRQARREALLRDGGRPTGTDRDRSAPSAGEGRTTSRRRWWSRRTG